MHRTVEEFRRIAEPLYGRDPVGNTVELTLLRANTFDDDALLLTVSDDGIVVGATLQTPPYPLACNGLPVITHAPIAAELARVRPDLTGVRGRRDLAVSFAGAWHSATGRRGDITTEERLYRLGTLRPPAGVGGAARRAGDADRGVLVDWVERFFVETFNDQRGEAAGRRFVANATAVGDRFVVWEDRGAPVSMALLRAPAAGVSRIGPVFTPSSARGRGYGSAVTAAAAALAHRDGVGDVVLFTDLANPTSNAIYRRIGFEAVADSVRIDFPSG